MQRSRNIYLMLLHPQRNWKPSFPKLYTFESINLKYLRLLDSASCHWKTEVPNGRIGSGPAVERIRKQPFRAVRC